MKKNVLAMSIAALVGGLGFAGGASAGVFSMPAGTPVGSAGTTASTMVVSTDGLGHLLLTPYYTAQPGFATIINLTNTDQINGKAVKVRFRGAANSDDVFDFQVLLSPGDVWTATISSSGTDGVATLQTQDNSCKVPEFGTTTVPFVLDRLPTRLSGTATALTSAQRNAQTREGYIEILNMADIIGYPTAGGPPFVFPTASNTPLFNTVKHVAGVAPCSSAVIGAAMTTDTVSAADAASRGFAAPTTGLMGSWTIINVGQSSAYSDAMVGIEARLAPVAPATVGLPGAGAVVFSPQRNVPVTAAQALLQTSDPLLSPGAGPAGLIAAQQFDFPDLSTPYIQAAAGVGGPLVTTQAQARSLSRSLAINYMANEFATETGIAGATDWTISQPTRRYSAAVDYSTASPAAFAIAVTDIGAPGIADDYYSSTIAAITNGTARTAVAANATGNISLNGNVICVSGIAPRHFDRNENTAVPATGSFVISPGTVTVATALQFCGETSVVSFNNGAASSTGALGASLTTFNTDTGVGLATNAVAGWTAMTVPGFTGGSGGLPILGSAFIRASVVPGGGAASTNNFGVNIEHRVVRPVTP